MRTAFLKWSLKLYLKRTPKWVHTSKLFDRLTTTAAYLCDMGLENDVHGIGNLIEMAHIM